MLCKISANRWWGSCPKSLLNFWQKMAPNPCARLTLWERTREVEAKCQKYWTEKWALKCGKISRVWNHTGMFKERLHSPHALDPITNSALLEVDRAFKLPSLREGKDWTFVRRVHDEPGGEIFFRSRVQSNFAIPNKLANEAMIQYSLQNQTLPSNEIHLHRNLSKFTSTT